MITLLLLLNHSIFNFKTVPCSLLCEILLSVTMASLSGLNEKLYMLAIILVDCMILTFIETLAVFAAFPLTHSLTHITAASVTLSKSASHFPPVKLNSLSSMLMGYVWSLINMTERWEGLRVVLLKWAKVSVVKLQYSFKKQLRDMVATIQTRNENSHSLMIYSSTVPQEIFLTIVWGFFWWSKKMIISVTKKTQTVINSQINFSIHWLLRLI